MVQVNMEEARRLLVEGRSVHMAGRLVRFYPSFRDVAKMLGKHPSSVARWAKREDLLRAREEVLAADRFAFPHSLPASTATLADDVFSLAAARWGSQRRAPAVRDVTTLARLLLCVVGVASANPRLLRSVDSLRRRLERRSGGR